jgi:probable rRNA maturation factor
MSTSPVQVAVYNAHRRYRVSKKAVVEYVTHVLGKRKAGIGVVFVDSHRIKSINRTFLNHNYVTDVISFTLEHTPAIEGEIYVNLDRAKSQSVEYGVSMACEIARLVIHGSLHLIGFDDAQARDAIKMKLEEDRHVRHWFGSATERKHL